jgi:hypothetical protein
MPGPHIIDPPAKRVNCGALTVIRLLLDDLANDFLVSVEKCCRLGNGEPWQGSSALCEPPAAKEFLELRQRSEASNCCGNQVVLPARAYTE